MPSDNSTLTRHGREVLSVFDLLGRDENDLTAALGFTLARSPELLHRFAARLLPAGQVDRAAVRMETRDDAGRTDLELDTGSQLVVVEAKRGWLLPGETQLSAYAPRVADRGAGLLVTLSNASTAWAALTVPATIGGVPVRHLPWSEVQDDLRAARRRARGEQRFWLDELHAYLRRAIKVRDPADSWTYCVVINDQHPSGGGSRSFRDFVDDGIYFHPFGTSGWPRTPPNFLALRWKGKVQRVHRVTGSEVITELQEKWPDIPRTPTSARPHVVYQLGPPLPGPPIPNGRQYRANRLWVLLDQLLTSSTLAEAYDHSVALTAE